MLAKHRAVFGDAIVGRVAHVREVGGDGVVQLSDGSRAHVAVSCLLRPQRGDRIVLAELAAGEVFVQAILERVNSLPATLEVAGAQQVTLTAPRLALCAIESAELQSLRDIDVTAATGRVSLSAAHVTVAALESIVHTAKAFLGHLETYAVRVRSVLCLHGQQAILTAERDMKLDAERISLG